MKLTRFFYEDGAGGNAGGDAGAAGAAAAAAAASQPESVLTADQLKDYGIENAEQLQTILRQHKESAIPAEEKQRKENERKADVMQFSVKNNIASLEDFTQADSLKNTPDRDLLFKKFDKEWREDNPDVTDPDEIAAGVKAAFEAEYRLNSPNEKAKARGEARMAKEAAEMRNPVISKVEQANTQYNERKALEGKVPEFETFVNKLIEKVTPEKVAISKVKEGEAEVEIEVEFSKDDRKELAKLFRTPKTFAAFQSATDPKALEDDLTKKMDGFLRLKYFDTAVSKSYEKGKGAGTAQGSTVGAGQPYGIVKGQGKSSANAGTGNDVMTEVRASHNAIREKHAY
jgi:hypothetical protein